MAHLYHGGFGSCQAVLSLFLLFLELIYLRGWISLLTIPEKTLSFGRALSFLLGLVLIWVAVGSPLAMLDRELLTLHMVQHLLLMTLAPPLIWLGRPAMPLRLGLPQRFAEKVVDLKERSKRLADVLTSASVSWFCAAAVLVLWHIPAALTLGLRSAGWHFFEHASFLVSGLLFWRPVIYPSKAGKWPEFSILLYLFFATLPCDILAGLLVFGDRVLYPVYGASRPFGLSAMADQQSAGALMWTCVTVVYLVAGGIVTVRLLSPHHRHNNEWTLAETKPLQELSHASEVR